jgi:hypothetical protein
MRIRFLLALVGLAISLPLTTFDSLTVKGQDFGPVAAKGYWSVIREGDDWKIRMLTFNTTPAPAATPSPDGYPEVTNFKGYGSAIKMLLKDRMQI